MPRRLSDYPYADYAYVRKSNLDNQKYRECPLYDLYLDLCRYITSSAYQGASDIETNTPERKS